jgi:hypothetical protein
VVCWLVRWAAAETEEYPYWALNGVARTGTIANGLSCCRNGTGIRWPESWEGYAWEIGLHRRRRRAPKAASRLIALPLVVMVVRADPWNQEFQAARTWYLRIMMSICQSQATSPVLSGSLLLWPVRKPKLLRCGSPDSGLLTVPSRSNT